MLEPDTIEARLKLVIFETLETPSAKDAAPSDRLHEDLGADSLDLVELVIAVEEEFKINVADEAALSLVTVGDILALIKALINKGE